MRLSKKMTEALYNKRFGLESQVLSNIMANAWPLSLLIWTTIFKGGAAEVCRKHRDANHTPVLSMVYPSTVFQTSPGTSLPSTLRADVTSIPKKSRIRILHSSSVVDLITYLMFLYILLLYQILCDVIIIIIIIIY